MTGALSPRERDVAHLVARGLTNAEIGIALGISPLTAKWHVSKMLRKLGLKRRVQLALAALDLGLLGAGADDPPSGGVTPPSTPG